MKAGFRKTGILLALCGVLLTGCTNTQATATSPLEEGDSDVAYVQEKGTLVVGVTDFAPMDYRDGDDWKGFDADLARAFAESLDVNVEFKEIDWDKKTQLLENGEIDCIWNAMTMTQELQEAISCSDPYLSNAQVIVLRGDDHEEYGSAEDCQHLLFAVESGSTGEDLLKERKYRYTAYSTQKEALKSVQEKKSDAAVIDIVMAAYYTEDGQDFDSLKFDIALNDEKLCVGFRRNSDLKDRGDKFLEEAASGGTIRSLAEQYGIEKALQEQK